YDTRHQVGIGFGVASLVALGIGTYMLFGPGRPEFPPPLDISSCGLDENCVNRKFAENDAQRKANEDAARPYMYGSLAVLGASTIALIVAVYYLYNPNPISENEAKDLAADHNADLRKQLGLPGRQARTERHRPRDVVIAPYVDHASNGGGFA